MGTSKLTLKNTPFTYCTIGVKKDMFSYIIHLLVHYSGNESHITALCVTRYASILLNQRVQTIRIYILIYSK